MVYSSRKQEDIKVDMARRLRSTKEDAFELGYVFERMVKGMRNEMNTVLCLSLIHI